MNISDLEMYSVGEDELIVENEEAVSSRRVGSVPLVQFRQPRPTAAHPKPRTRALDWKFRSGRFIDLVSYDSKRAKYEFNGEVTESLLKHGKRISLLGVYNQPDTLLGFQRDCVFDVMDFLMKRPSQEQGLASSKVSCISLFDQPIYNQYDQSYIFVAHLHNLANKTVQQQALQLLTKISDTILLNLNQPDSLKDFLKNVEQDPSLSAPALVLLSHGYSYSHLSKNGQQLDMQAHFDSAVLPRMKLTAQLQNTFRSISAFNLPKEGNITKLLKEIRLQILLVQRVKYVEQLQMFSSNILSFYLEQQVAQLNSRSSQAVDLSAIVSKYYSDIVLFAYDQAIDSYNRCLEERLINDQPHSYDQIYEIIKMCRVAAMEKFTQISEEAQNSALFKEKQSALLKAIKEKEISTLQINEQLSDQHCQFVHDNIEFNNEFSTKLQQPVLHLSDLFAQNQQYFQEAKGVRVQQQFLDLHQKSIAQFLESYLKTNQDKLCTVENVVEKRMAQLDGQIVEHNQQLKNDLDVEQRKHSQIQMDLQQVKEEAKQAEHNFQRQKTMLQQAQASESPEVEELENQLRLAQGKKKRNAKLEQQYQQQEQEIERLKQAAQQLDQEYAQELARQKK